jgi:cell wall-associated NlpC family hydrolase
VSWVAIVCLALLNGGCSVFPILGIDVAKATAPASPVCMGPGKREERLRDIYDDWKGTRYRLGGSDASGLDCAAFVQTVYAGVFDVELPRTTRALLQRGKPVPRKDLAVGDLVFFQPEGYPRHVGVYVGDGEFTHVSAKRGVMLSRIDHGYWANHYVAARRVLDSSACER